MALKVAVEAGQVPVTVTARLRTGVCMDLPYGLDLAGLLAARVRRVNDFPGEAADSDDLPLPLGRCLTGPDWHWLASCAAPDRDDWEARTFYKVTDAAYAQAVADRPLPYFAPHQGPYRDQMMPSPVLAAHTLTWRAIGDPDRLEALLAPLRFIGRRRNVGEGAVLSWEITEHPAAGPAWVHHEGTDILRPVPVECVAAVEHRVGWYALRPPSWIPERLVACAMTVEEW